MAFARSPVHETVRFATFEQFWPHYVGEHRRPLCRAIHYAALPAAAAAAVAAAVSGAWAWLLLVPLAGYAPAWLAHALVERNRPATWRYPCWSLRGELRMLALALTGRMRREVARLYGSAAPARDAPLLGAATPAERRTT